MVLPKCRRAFHLGGTLSPTPQPGGPTAQRSFCTFILSLPFSDNRRVEGEDVRAAVGLNEPGNANEEERVGEGRADGTAGFSAEVSRGLATARKRHLLSSAAVVTQENFPPLLILFSLLFKGPL